MARRPRPLCSLVRHFFLPSSFCLVFLCICLRLRLRNPNRIRIRIFLHFVICFVSIRPPRLAVFEDEAGSSEDTKNEEAGLALRSPPRRAHDVLFSIPANQAGWRAAERISVQTGGTTRRRPGRPAPTHVSHVTRVAVSVFGDQPEKTICLSDRRGDAQKREARSVRVCTRVRRVDAFCRLSNYLILPPRSDTNGDSGVFFILFAQVLYVILLIDCRI